MFPHTRVPITDLSAKSSPIPSINNSHSAYSRRDRTFLRVASDFQKLPEENSRKPRKKRKNKKKKMEQISECTAPATKQQARRCPRKLESRLESEVNFARETLHPSRDQFPRGLRDLRGSAWTVLSARIRPKFGTQRGCHGPIEHRPGHRDCGFQPKEPTF